jgi:hypothetical protein
MSRATVGVLSSSLDEQHATSMAGPSASGNNLDIIRSMLREQKRECSALHANPIFKEFKLQWKQSKGHHSSSSQEVIAPPVIDDLDAGTYVCVYMYVRSA